MDCIILAGGLGTRLRPLLPDFPKPIAPICGIPFLKLLIERMVRSQIIDRCILALGYKAEKIEATLKDLSFPIVYSREEKPLGTGGALKRAATMVQNYPILALNGDTFMEVDLKKLLQWHQEKGADATIVCREIENAERYGSIKIEEGDRVRAFREKIGQKGWINGGVYLFERDILEKMPQEEVFSLEQDLFPAILEQKIYAFRYTGLFIDIGTPETYLEAQKLLKTTL